MSLIKKKGQGEIKASGDNLQYCTVVAPFHQVRMVYG